jgi:accessory gene regulator protein AgrB
MGQRENVPMCQYVPKASLWERRKEILMLMPILIVILILILILKGEGLEVGETERA